MIAYLDCATGVSGDKLLGALVDAGFDLDVLRAALASAGAADVSIDASSRSSYGVRAVGIEVDEANAAHRSWKDIVGILEHAALDEPVRERSLLALRTLGAAEAR